MQRKRLIASAAIAPFLIYASGALAETTITDARTTPVQTSDSNDDVRVTETGSIRPTAGGGPALEMDTDHDVTNQGMVGWVDTDLDGVVGIQAAGGLTGNIVNSGAITLSEDYPADGVDADPDDDGDADIPFAGGEDRAGILVTPGVGLLDGSITNTGAITVEGNQSYGIRLQAGLTGTLMHRGSISVTGDNGYGIRVEGPIEGDLEVRGSVAVTGENSVGVSVEDEVDGLFRVQGAVSARGYRATSSPATAEDFAKLDEDDLLQGGPAVQVMANVDGGVLVDGPRPLDTDADAETPDNDEDDDGIPDAEEGFGGAISVSGSAPALLIGSDTQAVSIGAVGTGDDAYGFINRGAISAQGIHRDFDDEDASIHIDHPATAVQIGGRGFDTLLAGGMRNEGAISASAVDADAIGVRLADGAVLGAGGGGALVNTGSISSQITAISGPTPPSTVVDDVPGYEEANTAYGVRIEAGALVDRLENDGVISAVAQGERGSAVAVMDAGGVLATITNTRRIQAAITPTDNADDTDDEDLDPNNEEITGLATAIDVSASTTGVTITQTGVDDGDDGDDDIDDPDADGDGVDDADEPLIFGSIRLGSGGDSVNILNGQMIGAIHFGGGSDSLTIGGGALVQGRLLGTSAGYDLAIDVADGRLFITETDTVYGSSLDVGEDGQLIVAIDPDGDEETTFMVDSATFADGAQIGVTLKGLLTLDNLEDVKNYLIVDADTLDAGSIDESLLGEAPYLYVVGVEVDEVEDNVELALRRRRADEAGLNEAQTAAYDAVYRVLGEDESVQAAILRQQTREDFLALYDQLLPDQGEGLFSALDMAQIAISRAVATRPDLRRRYGPDSFWVQELNLQVQREGGETLGSEAKAFGFVGGYEATVGDGGALGATLAYITAEETDDAATVGEQTTVSQFEAGVYWRRMAGSWLFSVRGGAGYAWFDGTRRFIDPASRLIREATADWTGMTASAHVGVQYEQRLGRYYVRPGLYADYLYLSEGERVESGAGALNQVVEERTSSRLSSTAEVAFGAEFGRDFWWRPEMRVGVRQILAGEVGDTTASFAGGNAFTISAMDPGEAAAVVALALKMGTALSYLALEGEVEAAENEQRYNVKLNGRVMF